MNLHRIPASLGARASGLLLPIHLFVAGCLAILGCAPGKSEKKSEFFTSGSREADQRATQRMAKEEQLAGSGEGSGEKGVTKAKHAGPTDGSSPVSRTNSAALVQGKLALFDRLGGQPGISNIVADFLPRALQDPRVNWQRNGVRGGIFHRPSPWAPSPENIAVLQNHMMQFLALATGGPSQYDGKEMKSTHDGMNISNAEFDAVVGDLKVSLDRLQVPNSEQKALLAIVESTRTQVVTVR